MFRSRANLVLVVVLSVAWAGACGKRPPVAASVEAPPLPPAVAPPAPPSPPAPPPSPTAASPLSEDELFARKTLDELNSERPLGDALFDLDDFTIRDDARAVLQRNADWMRRWPSTRIRVEGHGDERGTSEYNLALGQRRSVAVKDYLVGLGIAAARIDVISKGEEAPVCVESHEGCWQRNRRGQSVVTAK